MARVGTPASTQATSPRRWRSSTSMQATKIHANHANYTHTCICMLYASAMVTCICMQYANAMGTCICMLYANAMGTCICILYADATSPSRCAHAYACYMHAICMLHADATSPSRWRSSTRIIRSSTARSVPSSNAMRSTATLARSRFTCIRECIT